MKLSLAPCPPNPSRYATRQALARALCDYILYAEHNPKKAVELAAAALSLKGASAAGGESGDWWWNARLGKAYYQLGMLRDAEKMFSASLRACDMVVSHLELAKARDLPPMGPLSSAQ